MNAATALWLGQIALDATKAVIQADETTPSPSDLAKRLVDIGMQLVPVAELRTYLNAADAKTIDQAVDVAEEAKLAALKISANPGPSTST